MKNILRFIFDKLLLGQWLRGYRSYILFALTFIYNAVAWLLDVRLFDFLCNYWQWWCSFETSPVYNQIAMALAALAYMLRIDAAPEKIITSESVSDQELGT